MNERFAWTFHWIEKTITGRRTLGVMPIHEKSGKRLVDCVICGKMIPPEMATDTVHFSSMEGDVTVLYPICSHTCAAKFEAAAKNEAWLYQSLFDATSRALRTIYENTQKEEAK